MDIKGVIPQSQQFQTKSVNKQFETNIEAKPVSSSDKVTISEEALTLFNEGGGHPDRPKKD